MSTVICPHCGRTFTLQPSDFRAPDYSSEDERAPKGPFIDTPDPITGKHYAAYSPVRRLGHAPTFACPHNCGYEVSARGGFYFV